MSNAKYKSIYNGLQVDNAVSTFVNALGDAESKEDHRVDYKALLIDKDTEIAAGSILVPDANGIMVNSELSQTDIEALKTKTTNLSYTVADGTTIAGYTKVNTVIFDANSMSLSGSGTGSYYSIYSPKTISLKPQVSFSAPVTFNSGATVHFETTIYAYTVYLSNIRDRYKSGTIGDTSYPMGSLYMREASKLIKVASNEGTTTTYQLEIPAQNSTLATTADVTTMGNSKVDILNPSTVNEWVYGHNVPSSTDLGYWKVVFDPNSDSDHGARSLVRRNNDGKIYLRDLSSATPDNKEAVSKAYTSRTYVPLDGSATIKGAKKFVNPSSSSYGMNVPNMSGWIVDQTIATMEDTQQRQVSRFIVATGDTISFLKSYFTNNLNAGLCLWDDTTKTFDTGLTGRQAVLNNEYDSYNILNSVFASQEDTVSATHGDNDYFIFRYISKWGNWNSTPAAYLSFYLVPATTTIFKQFNSVGSLFYVISPTSNSTSYPDRYCSGSASLGGWQFTQFHSNNKQIDAKTETFILSYNDTIASIRAAFNNETQYSGYSKFMVWNNTTKTFEDKRDELLNTTTYDSLVISNSALNSTNESVSYSIGVPPQNQPYFIFRYMPFTPGTNYRRNYSGLDLYPGCSVFLLSLSQLRDIGFVTGTQVILVETNRPDRWIEEYQENTIFHAIKSLSTAAVPTMYRHDIELQQTIVGVAHLIIWSPVGTSLSGTFANLYNFQLNNSITSCSFVLNNATGSTAATDWVGSLPVILGVNRDSDNIPIAINIGFPSTSSSSGWDTLTYNMTDSLTDRVTSF